MPALVLYHKTMDDKTEERNEELSDDFLKEIEEVLQETTVEGEEEKAGGSIKENGVTGTRENGSEVGHEAR